MNNGQEAIRGVQVAVVAPAMLAWGLDRLLQSERPHLEPVGSAGSLPEAESMLRRCRPDVTIVDLDDGFGTEAIVALKACCTSALIALTSCSDREVLDRAVFEGVRGIVRKNDAPAALVKAIQRVHEGELWIDRSSTGRIFMELSQRHQAQDNHPDRLKMAALTPRERQTIVAVASDSAAPGKIIARRLCISEHTLRNHLSAIYAKLGVANRLDLYAYAKRNNLDQRQSDSAHG